MYNYAMLMRRNAPAKMDAVKTATRKVINFEINTQTAQLRKYNAQLNSLFFRLFKKQRITMTWPA